MMDSNEVIEQLRLEFETNLLESTPETRKSLLRYLNLEGIGKGLFAQLRIIREKLDESLAINDDPEFYLRDLLSVLKNGPPPLEKTGEEEFGLPDERGAGVDTDGQGVDTDLPKVDSLLAKIRERQERELNRLKEQINSYSTQTKKGNEHSVHELPGAEHKASLFRRDFKIAGQIGEPGQPEKLAYVSLIHQIDASLKRGYDESEVVEAVIKAISPNSSLRSYILTLPERSLKKLRKILRVFYQERNAADLYQELVITCQGSKETPQQYLLRALDARNKVLFAGKEEGNGQDYSHQLVQNAFLKHSKPV